MHSLETLSRVNAPRRIAVVAARPYVRLHKIGDSFVASVDYDEPGTVLGDPPVARVVSVESCNGETEDGIRYIVGYYVRIRHTFDDLTDVRLWGSGRHAKPIRVGVLGGENRRTLILILNSEIRAAEGVSSE